MKKICVVTGTRAEYGLLYWLLRGIEESKDLELQLIVTGSHLSHEFGLTYKQIEEDGFKIDKKVENIVSSDTSVGINKSMGLTMIGFGDAFEDLKPDLTIILGDRFEVFCAASASHVSRIPIGHIHGGESTEGAFDEAFRHSITKMSSLHFTTTEEYKNRVIQLGEDPSTVFNVGSPGLEHIERTKLLTKKEVEEDLDIKFRKKNILVTFHPVTYENQTSGNQFSILLEALNKMKDTSFIFTKSNADTDGRIINDLIDSFVSENPSVASAYTSLGQLRYLSVMKHVDAVIGNSSSGIIEAPSFSTATINIGDRQKGRVRARSIIDVEPDLLSINNALIKLDDSKFLSLVKKKENPHGKGFVSRRILKVIKKDLHKVSLKKKFFDIKTGKK